MYRLFALTAVAVLVTSAAAQDESWKDKTVKLNTDTKLGTKQAGGLLRDGAALRRGQGFTVKSDDGTFLELVGQTGHILKSEAELFAAREMPKKLDPKPKADAKDLWTAGTKVLPRRHGSTVQFGDRDADGRAIFYVLSGLSFAVQHDNGDGWVRVRDHVHEGWVAKEDLIPRDDAAAHFEKIIQANPRDTFALFMRAASLHELGKTDAAIEAYTKYLEVNPSDRGAYNNRALMWVAKKEFDKALADYDRAIELSPDTPLYYANRASVLVTKKEFEKALADCDKALELEPKFASAAVNKGRALVGLKKYDEAGKSFEAAIKTDPTTARLNSYAWVLATCPDEKGRNGKKALELSLKAVEKSGKSVSWVYIDTLAAAYAETGDFESAVTQQQKALEDKTIPAETRKQMEARLDLYKNKKPFHGDE